MVCHVVPSLYGLLRLTLPPRATIKTASSEDTTATEYLRREYTSYRLSGVSSAACFWQMYDHIDDCTVSLEWLDTTLAEVKYLPDMRTYTLINSGLGAALVSSDILDRQGYVNTGAVSNLRESASAYQSRLQTCQYPPLWYWSESDSGQSRGLRSW